MEHQTLADTPHTYWRTEYIPSFEEEAKRQQCCNTQKFIFKFFSSEGKI